MKNELLSSGEIRNIEENHLMIGIEALLGSIPSRFSLWNHLLHSSRLKSIIRRYLQRFHCITGFTVYGISIKCHITMDVIDRVKRSAEEAVCMSREEEVRISQ